MKKATTPAQLNKTMSLFTRLLMGWHDGENLRQMPWKGEKDPYKIWLSEIILQQTRVEQGRRYYENFLAAFPTARALAEAPPEKVFKLWEGLGYYSRCRNLLAAALQVRDEHKGKFPDTYTSIAGLKGVGPYTAAAIASFAFNLPHAVVDGNVYRVLSRFFSIHTPIDSTVGKKEFASLAQEVLDKTRPGDYNQAIMDFGATICKPQPLCTECMLRLHCSAFREGTEAYLPVKSKKPALKKRWMHYLVVKAGDKVLVRQRHHKDIWQYLQEFFLVETSKPLSIEELLASLHYHADVKKTTAPEAVEKKMQKLTHQEIHFLIAKLNITRPVPVKDYTWINIDDARQLAFPRTLKSYLDKHL